MARTAERTRTRQIDYRAVAEKVDRIVDQVSIALEGKDEVIRQALVCLMSSGHLLIEDVPGVGKTMLAKALARSISCSASRIQFTPDLLPSDIVGVSIYNDGSRNFDFRPGPIFSNLVLGDEINRASPKTQSALLEAMEERQVTVDQGTYQIEEPFMVIATQNPLEHEGVFPMPQSQIDRFTMRIQIGYPDHDTEIEILDTHGAVSALEDVQPVLSARDVVSLVRVTRALHVADEVKDYIVQVCEATRRHPSVEQGASPRASLFLLRTARAMAAAAGRDYVLPDDVKALIPLVLAHRLVLLPDAELRGGGSGQVLDEVVSRTPAPAGGSRGRRT